MNRTLAALLLPLLFYCSIAVARIGEVQPGAGHVMGYTDSLAANSHEYVFLGWGPGSDIYSTERGWLTFTPNVVESGIRVNEAGDFVHTEWVGPGVRGFFVNGAWYATPATVGSISDDGEIIWYNPTGTLWSSERALLQTFPVYHLRGIDVNDAGVYTYATGTWPIYTIWRSDESEPIGQGWNPRINNHGNVCWTAAPLNPYPTGPHYPVCDGEPVEFKIGLPEVHGSHLYTLDHVDFLDVTDDELILQKVWDSPLQTDWDGVVHQIVRVTLPPK